MGVGNEESQLDRLRPKLMLKRLTQETNPRAGIEHNDLAVSSNFDTTGIPAVTNRRRSRSWDRAADAPELDASSGRERIAHWKFGRVCHANPMLPSVFREEIVHMRDSCTKPHAILPIIGQNALWRCVVLLPEIAVGNETKSSNHLYRNKLGN